MSTQRTSYKLEDNPFIGIRR
uniref:Uncharacterized protein n=1 Tax=Anguilla anguilla TaxID=7936 RepID=A0A0E9PI12_ANGAN